MKGAMRLVNRLFLGWRSRWKLSWVGVLVALLILGVAACAQDVPDIDRTQPRAVQKSIFRTHNEDGSLRTWYYLQTVIDVPFGAGLTFIGEQMEGETIVWEVTEQFLYAYRAYEFIKNTEQKHQRSETGGYRGAAVAAFAIESHFDIQRTYNAATGEQANVIVENTSDRPWHERKYMRVDFSRNRITDFRFVAANVTQNPVAYYIPETEKNNKDRARITENNIDIVHKIFASPQVDPDLTYYYGEPFPVCWLYTHLTHDCLGQTIKIRSSFVPTNKRGYKPVEYSQKKMDKFGYFRTTRYSYDRGYGVTEQDTKFYINRWSIWRNEGECKREGSPTPYSNCTVQQIPIYLNQQFPEDLKNAASTVLAEWNKIFREMIQIASGKDQGPVFVLCPNNPVKEGDSKLCGEVGTAPQIGDIRYNFLYWVDAPGRAAPLGYGPANVDPQTGEIISATAYVYGAELDAYANYATDLVRVLNGDLKQDDVINATHVATYFQNLQKTQSQNRIHWHSHGTQKFARQLRLEKRKAVFKQRLKRGIGKRDWVSANLRNMRNAPGLEDILKGEVFRALGLHVLSPNGAITPKIRQLYSFDRLTHRNFYAWSRLRMKRLARRSILMADFVDDSIIARALKLKKEFASGQGQVDYDKIRKKIREAVFLSTSLHEVGHILGLRHNFAGSSDALNYHDKYWELKAKTVPPGSKTPLPEYRYPPQHRSLLDNAIREGMREFQYSSIMDYGGSFSSDIQGLGKYDKAAIMYGYADLVQVFQQTTLQRGDASSKLYPEEWHYTQLPVLIAGPKNSYEEQTQSLKDSNRKWVLASTLSSQANLVEIPYRFCSDEYHGGAANCYAFDQGADYYERVRNLADKYWYYYIFDAFKRSRVTFGDVGSYIGTIYARYFSPIADQYKHFLNDWWYAGSGFSCGGEDWYIKPECGENGFVAAVTAFNFFARIIQTPDVGCYRRAFNNATAQLTHVANGACESGVRDGYQYVNVPLGMGRRMVSTFNYDKYGYEFAWKPTSIGTWWDKYMAVMALGDPYTSFYGVDTESNFNDYMINFNTMFGRYVNNLVGAFIVGRTSLYGPTIENNKLVYRDPIRIAGASQELFDPAPTYKGASLNPNEQYSAQYFAGLLGAVYFSGDLNDQYFNESLKISVRGRDDSPEVPDDVKKDPNRYVEVVDPGSHRIYYAAKANNMEGLFQTEPTFFSVGYEFLKQVKDRYFQADGKTLKDTVARWEVEAEFHFINVIIGWVRAGEYNKDEE